jgi:hypothetical protein
MPVICDFHNHTCLSPCGSLEQSPAVLARRARGLGLDLVAITDHNSALNVPAFAECARREGLAALYGIEVCTTEEVHVLCLFAEVGAVLDFGSYLYAHLPQVRNDPERFGIQVVVDADEGIIDIPDTCFAAALDIGFDELCASAAAGGALVIPAHIDRPAFGVLSQLGFLPHGPYGAVEALRPLASGIARGYTVVTGSDAHHPDQVGRRCFGLDLVDGWLGPSGVVDLEAVKTALAARPVHLPPGWCNQSPGALPIHP